MGSAGGYLGSFNFAESCFDSRVLPCVIFEDEHLLAVNKPAGWNTHAPSPYAGEGIYDWLRHREPRWANLAIIHRLDKETSGVMVFAKTSLANRSLTEQFTKRMVPEICAGDGSQSERRGGQKLAGSRRGKVREPASARGWRASGDAVPPRYRRDRKGGAKGHGADWVRFL